MRGFERLGLVCGRFWEAILSFRRGGCVDVDGRGTGEAESIIRRVFVKNQNLYPFFCNSGRHFKTYLCQSLYVFFLGFVEFLHPPPVPPLLGLAHFIEC